MKIEDDVFKGLFRDLWNMVMDSKDMNGSEADWEKLLETGKAISNDPRYTSIRDLAIEWIVSYVSFLEKITQAAAENRQEA